MEQHFNHVMKRFYELLFTVEFDSEEYKNKAQELLNNIDWKRLLDDDWACYEKTRFFDSDYPIKDFIEEKWMIDIYELVGQYSV